MKRTEKSLRIDFSSKTDIDFNLRLGECYLTIDPPVTYEITDMRMGKMLKIANQKYNAKASLFFKRIGLEVVNTMSYLYIPMKYIGSIKEVLQGETYFSPILFDMIEFGLKHRHSGTWHKKFPRKKIEKLNPKHLGMREHLECDWFEDRRGYLSWKDIDKFLEKNVGKNVDEVFSEFIKRAKKFKHDVNLRERFFSTLNNTRKYIRSNYELDSENRIVKRKEIKEKEISAQEALDYNAKHYPSNIKSYLKETELIYIGDFYLRDRITYSWKLVPIYICNRDWYNLVITEGLGKKRIKYESLYKVSIPFKGIDARGVPKSGYAHKLVFTGKVKHYSFGDFKIFENKIYPFSEGESDYIFFTKDNNVRTFYYWA